MLPHHHLHACGQLQQPRGVALRRRQRCAMQCGERTARGASGVGGGGVAVPQRLRERLRKQRAAGANEGDERGVRAGGGVGGEGEVL
jgi:hypothetical protein